MGGRHIGRYLPAAAGAALPASAGAAGEALTLPGVGELVGNLALVLGLIVVLAWLARRLQLTGPAQAGPLRVLASVPVGQRERIVLIEAGERQLLVGVAAGQLRTLHVLDVPLAVPPATGVSGGTLPAALRRLAGR